MKGRKILSALLSLVMVTTIVPAKMLTAYAATDAMSAIESAVGEYQVGDTVTVNDDGYIGIPVEATTYYDTSKGAVTDKYYGTPIMLYVVNTGIERIGTDTDAEIIESMLDRGYVVTVIDYLNNAKAVSPDLDWSMIKVRAKASDGSLYTDKSVFPSKTYEEIYTVPAGYDIDMNNVFWEFDKHATDGSLERIVEFWNNDFRGCNRDRGYLIKWVHEDGTRKETQNGFDGSAPQWYNEDGTLNNETGEWTYIPYTKAVEVTDPVKLDGSPLDYNLYATVVYPTNPKDEVAVMAFGSSSEALAMGLRQRPHFNGFLFRGYTAVTYDYGFVPTEKEVNTYYSNAGTYTGGVTGDNRTYSLQFFNDKLINTAAIRWIRYIAKTDDRFSNWAADDSLGVYGISKSGWINFLGTSHPEDLPIYSKFVGHHGETRYDNGLTEDIVKDGYTIDGGELQPWQTVNGEEIASNVNFIYQSVGATNLSVTEDFCPTYAHMSMNDGLSTINYGTSARAVLEEYDIPSVCLELPVGHDFAHGIDPRNGADGYDALYSTAGYYLQNDAAKVVYITPMNGTDDVEDNTEITVQFTGPVAESEITKVTIKDSKGNALKGTWEPSHGNCLWKYKGDALTGCETYTITVPNTIKAENGLALEDTATSTFKTSQEADFDALAFNNGKKVYTTDKGAYVYFTMPDKSAVSGFTADSLKLRFKVTNDAANAVKVYALNGFSKDAPTLAGKGTLIDTVYLRSDGFYQVDISDYVSDIAPGTEIAFFIETQKEAGETVITNVDFSKDKGGFAVKENGTYEYCQIPGTSKYGLRLTVGSSEFLSKSEYQAPDYSNTYYHTDYFMNRYITPYTTSMPEDWYGRRFHVKFSMFDTIKRDISLYTTRRNTETFFDQNQNAYNMITTPNTENTLEFDYQVYGADIGRNTKALMMHVTPSGYPEEALYLTEYKVTEIVTDVEIGEASIVIEDAPLILDTEYGTIPEQYKSVEKYPFVLFKNSDKSFVKAYDVDSEAYANLLYEVFHNMRGSYKSGYTLLMRRDYTHTGTAYPNHPHGSVGNTIDLGGYTLSSPNDALFDMTAAYVTTSGAPATTGFVLKNGKIAVKDHSVIKGWMYSGGDGKTYDMDFENIEFVYASGATAVSPIFNYVECSRSECKTFVGTYDITFNNCKFNFKNNAPAGVLTMIPDGSVDGTLVGDIKVIGGEVISNNDIAITKDVNAAGAVTFTANSDGKYLTASVLSGKTATCTPSSINGGRLNFANVGANNGYDSYEFKEPDMSEVLLASLTSSNKLVVVGDKSIVVSSSPMSTSYQVSSDAVVSALTGADGWTLSYVNSKKEAATVAHVKSGYIKATHSDYADVYIPITKKGDVVDNDLSDNIYSASNATYSYEGGVGGKAQNDMSATFTAGNTEAKISYIRVGSGTATDAVAFKQIPYTVKFRVYADGDATAGVNYRWTDAEDKYRLFRWYPDGTFKYNSNGTLVNGGTLERGKWHDIAVVYCSQRNRYTLYVDGVMMGENSNTIPGTYYTMILLAMEVGSKNGKVAFSDLEAHYGYYYAPPTVSNITRLITSDNECVVVGTNSIAVFSHPTNASRKISSEALVSALTVEDDWSISYVNDNKVADITDSVTSGYIKLLQAGYEDIYIPITAKGAVIDNDMSDNAATCSGTSKATYAYSNGVATFTAGVTPTDDYASLGIGAGAGTAGAIEKLPYTIKFKMKTTGDAIGAVNWRWNGNDFAFIRLNADGTFSYKESRTFVNGGSLAKGVWHDVALVYDHMVETYHLWIDGQCISTNVGVIPTNYYAKVQFCMGTGSANGTVSYKDFDTYYGYYSVAENVKGVNDITMSGLATSEVYEKDGEEYVFVAVTTPSATDMSLYNTFVCTDGETVKGIAVSDLVTTRVTGEVEIAIVVENVLKSNADNFQAVFTPLKVVNAN